MSPPPEPAGTPDVLTDEEVVRRIRGGNPALFELLMRRHNQRVYRVARAIVKDEAEAEDVMQQAYVNAYTHLDQFASQARFSTWLTRIATYEALGRLRRRGRHREVEVMDDGHVDGGGVRLADRSPDPEQQAWTGELRALLEASVDALPEIYRAVFVLRDVEGLDTAEAAECLGVTEDAVKTRLSRARGLLRDQLYARAGVASAELYPFRATRCDRVVSRVLLALDLQGCVH